MSKPLSLAALVPLCALAVRANATPPAAPTAETVKLFDPAANETPESLQFDHQGNLLVSLALTGELRRIAPDGTETTLARLPIAPEVQPCGNAFGVPIMGGLALDPHDNVFVTVVSCDVTRLGIYRVDAGTGAVSRVSALSPDAVPNGIAYRDGWLYVADTNLGRVWRVAADGSSTSVWVEDALLAPFPDFAPGPNGLQIFRDEVYVGVSDHGHLVAYRILGDGAAGPPRIHATGVGFDDFAFDARGNVYATTDPFNLLVKIAPDGSVETLLTAADGLDGPTSAAFGVRGENQVLYVANAAFPFFSTTHRPSLMRVDVGVPGMPR